MIFISYAHRDGADLAQRIHRDLTSEHLDPWLDTTRLTSGASWTNVIEENLDHSNVVLALLTKGSYRVLGQHAKGVGSEYQYANRDLYLRRTRSMLRFRR